MTGFTIAVEVAETVETAEVVEVAETAGNRTASNGELTSNLTARVSLDTLLLRLLFVLEPYAFLIEQYLLDALSNSRCSEVFRKYRGEIERLRFRRLRSRASTSTKGSFSTSECGGIFGKRSDETKYLC